MQQNQVGARMIYDNIIKKYPGAIVTQSFLRLEQEIVVGKTVYEFPVAANQSTAGVKNTEQRLNTNDLFEIAGLGIFLGTPTTAADAAFKLLTFPDTVAFSTAGSAAAAMALYNARFSIGINNKKYLPAWDIDRHLKIPMTQVTAAVNSPASEADGAEYGYYPLEPNIKLANVNNNVLQIEFPVGITVLHPLSRIVIKFRGMLVQP